MCDITDKFQRGEIIPNMKNYISPSKRTETAKSISRILRDNDNVIISEKNQEKIKKLIFDMKH